MVITGPYQYTACPFAAKYHCPPFRFTVCWLGAEEILAGGANLGTGRDKTRTRARVFMIASHLHHGPHIGPRFTEPFLFSVRTQIAFADPSYLR